MLVWPVYLLQLKHYSEDLFQQKNCLHFQETRLAYLPKLLRDFFLETSLVSKARSRRRCLTIRRYLVCLFVCVASTHPDISFRRQVVGSSRFSNKQKVVLFGMVNGQRALLSVGKGQVDQSCSSYCCFCSSFRNICPQKAVLNFYLKFDDLHKSTNSNQIIGLLLLENLSPICAITRHKCN